MTSEDTVGWDRAGKSRGATKASADHARRAVLGGVRLRLMGYAVEVGWALALVSGFSFAAARRWNETALAASVFLIGRSVDLLIARIEKADAPEQPHPSR